MNKLQNDFTTKQQSEKLLALGMPRLSANFYYDDENEVQIVRDPEFELQSKGYFPCWSVGRLIEILAKCNVFGTATIDWVQFCSEQSPLQTIYDELCAGITQGVLDFSKLEE